MKFSVLSHVLGSCGHTTECMTLWHGRHCSSRCSDMLILLTPEESRVLMGGGQITLQSLCQLICQVYQGTHRTLKKIVFVFSVVDQEPPGEGACFQLLPQLRTQYGTLYNVISGSHYYLSCVIPSSSLFTSLSSKSWHFGVFSVCGPVNRPWEYRCSLTKMLLPVQGGHQLLAEVLTTINNLVGVRVHPEAWRHTPPSKPPLRNRQEAAVCMGERILNVCVSERIWGWEQKGPPFTVLSGTGVLKWRPGQYLGESQGELD